MESSARRRDEHALTPRQIYRRLDKYVIGQEEAKRAVAIAAYNHLKRVEARRAGKAVLLKKSNLLLIGPTGCGKTHLARQLAATLSVPFTAVDATEYTEAGYYGKDVEMMVAELLLRAEQKVEEAQRGIIFIDEVDKIARRSQTARNGAGSRDIGGEGVQQALLKLLEGREVYVPQSVASPWAKGDFVAVDTTEVLFICAGAYSDLLGYGGEDDKRPVGFGAAEVAHRPKPVSHKMLVDYGMLPEFLGRLPVTVQLQRLTEEELLRVLTEPPDAITREYAQLLALDGIDLELSPGAMERVVRFASMRGLGARGLRAVLEQVMREVMFDAPERRKRRVRITRAFVDRRLAHVD
ncbi:MAG: ATP-dependent Clp protease ATP-binding subunit ClpX, partial [Myxococcota bacterium]